MINIDKYITNKIAELFINNFTSKSNINDINLYLKNICGINNFFSSQNSFEEFNNKVNNSAVNNSNLTRREYGDFQTNEILSQKVVDYVLDKYKDIEFVLEPTCGVGNFILASIKNYNSLKKVVGIEIYDEYTWETKFKILSYYLENPTIKKPEIDIINENVFDYNFSKLADITKELNTLIIGNPPWVTNSELSTLNSSNLPKKTNLKNSRGLDALTGKGNFDIGESISNLLINYFQNHNGLFAFLIKNSVVKNLIQEQKRNNYNISQIEKLIIDSKKEFNVSVDACLFLAKLNTKPEYTCKEIIFYSQKFKKTFGWYYDKFVNSIEDYKKTSEIDGKSVFIWRSGIKHDCSKVMELEKSNGHFKNGFGEEFNIENNLVYGLIKSSDLKYDKIDNYRKLTIVTQSKIGQETNYIKDKFPLTHQYLNSHSEYFEQRKSSIYKDKPRFSIFGVGVYTFAKYKVAISGLYKTTHFSLVSPKDSKPIVLDDTCYFIGFDNLKMAEIAHFILNSDLVQKFLKSIIFSDSKRSINKDILMRIDFEKAVQNCNFESAKKSIEGLSFEHWEQFKSLLNRNITNQVELFSQQRNVMLKNR